MIVLIFHCVVPIVSHQFTRLDDLGATHEYSGHPDAAQPHLMAKKLEIGLTAELTTPSLL